jgi:ComF family protein
MLNLDQIIGLIAPDICLGCGAEGDVMCGQCMQTAGEPPVSCCAGCKALSVNSKTCDSCKSWLNIYAVVVANNYEGVYEQLIHSLKFDMKRKAVVPISKMMTTIAPNLPSDTIVCALPTASSRIRQRGFDHAKLLAKAYITQLPKEFPWNEWQLAHFLGRKSNVRQLGSSRAQRISQMEKEYYVKNPVNVKGKTILLLDDVMTTGASLSAAARVLKRSGAKRIYATVFAHKI